MINHVYRKYSLFLLLATFFSMVIIIPNSYAQETDDRVQEITIGSSALFIEISKDKVYVSNPTDGNIVVIDANTNKIVNTITSKVGVQVLEVVEEKNKIYVTVDGYPSVIVYDLATGEKIKEIYIGEPEITLWSKSDKPYGQREYITFQTEAIGLDYNPNTELLYAVHTTVNHINIIDTNTDTTIGDIPVGKTPLLIAIDNTRNIGYVTNWESSIVSVIDLESQAVTKNLQTGFAPVQMQIDYDNDQLYITHHASPHVTVIDLPTQKIDKKIKLDGPTHAVALNTKNKILHVTYMPESGVTGSGSAGKVDFVDTNTNEVFEGFSIDANPFIIGIDSEKQKLFASIIKDGIVLAVDLASDPEYFRVSSDDKESSMQDNNAGGGCLIATATYGSELAPQIQQLRELRDNILLQTESGTSFMNAFNDVYYSFSPIIADYERKNPAFKELVKVTITPMISSLSLLNSVDIDSEAKVLGYGIGLIVLNLAMYAGIPAVAIIAIKKKLSPSNLSQN